MSESNIDIQCLIDAMNDTNTRITYLKDLINKEKDNIFKLTSMIVEQLRKDDD